MITVTRQQLDRGELPAGVDIKPNQQQAIRRYAERAHAIELRPGETPGTVHADLFDSAGNRTGGRLFLPFGSGYTPWD